MDDAGLFLIDGDSLTVPPSKNSKRQSLNPGLRLAQNTEAIEPIDPSLPQSPVPVDFYSPPDPVSTVASPALISKGNLGAHAIASSIPSSSTVPQEVSNGLVTDTYGQKYLLLGFCG